VGNRLKSFNRGEVIPAAGHRLCRPDTTDLLHADDFLLKHVNVLAIDREAEEKPTVARAVTMEVTHWGEQGVFCDAQ
jgi:Flp pilus assembly protein CpaB